MGFLQNLFGQKKYPEEWNFYMTTIDDKAASIYLNLALHNVIPIKDKPNLSWISLKLNSPTENGLTTDEESKILFEIEDNLLDIIDSKNALYIGRLTNDGTRDFYFYSNNAQKFKSDAIKIFQTYSKYKIIIHSKEDKDWQAYADIYPNEMDFQSISNRSVLENLEKNGDNLTKPREVFHWIYFDKKSDLKNYLNAVIKENFELVNQDFHKDNEHPYRLLIKRIDMVNYNEIHNFTLYLWKLAKEHSGDYYGWETSVEKD